MGEGLTSSRFVLTISVCPNILEVGIIYYWACLSEVVVGACGPWPIPWFEKYHWYHAGILLPLPPSWRWMGGFRFLLAFRFHRPRAVAGWVASASCWHSASTAPELALDGRLPLPAGMNGPSSPLGGLPVVQAQPWAPPLEPHTKGRTK